MGDTMQVVMEYVKKCNEECLAQEQASRSSPCAPAIGWIFVTLVTKGTTTYLAVVPSIKHTSAGCQKATHAGTACQ